MKPYPIPNMLRTVCLVTLTFALNQSCTKDEELLKDAVLATPGEPLDENSVDPTEEEEEEEEEEEVVADSLAISESAPEDLSDFEEEDFTAKVYETRTTVFPSINDAHLQGGDGFNQTIVRLEENRRTSYLMFDLSQIDSIGGIVNKTNLEFTIAKDDGHGTVSIYKATSNNWSEEEIDAASAPEPDSLAGQLTSTFDIGSIQEVELDTAVVSAEVLSLVMIHEEGNDLAFASKENTLRSGPALVVTYRAPQDAEAILIEENFIATQTPQDSSESNNESSSEDLDSTTEESSEEEESNEDTITSEQNQEKASEEEGSTDEETTSEPEASNEEETTGQEEPSEDNQEEASGEEKTSEEENTESDQQNNNESDAPENEAPLAVAEANIISGTVPLKVEFKGSNSTDDKGIEQLVWDFRDGSTSKEINPEHTFEKTGTLEVRLTVTDAEGESHTDTVTVSIKEEEKVNEAPIASPKASPASGEAPLEVQFTGTESTDDKEIKNYRWDFKDGASTDTPNPSHTFTEAGEYRVVLNVEDEDGLSDARIVTVTVTGAENEAPQAIASGTPLAGDAPLEVQFKGTDSKDDKGITEYSWDFNDGSTTTNANPSHTFSAPGNYQVELEVRDKEGSTSSTTVAVTVNQPTVDNSSGGDSGDNSGDNGNGDENDSDGDTPSNGVKASSFGFNSSDATDAIEKAINSSYSTIIIDRQSSDWVVAPLNFRYLKNKTIILEEGVVLRAKAGAYRDSDRMFQLVNADNVQIVGYGATLEMDKAGHNGQQNHVLSIISSSNITVRGLVVKDGGGDGIYISRYGESEYCRNIRIEDVVSTHNQRQGMTIVSVDGLVVKNSTFSHSEGEEPGAGVDFESESVRDRFTNVTFDNCIFRDNFGPGILTAFSKTSSSSIPLDITFNNSYLTNNFSTSNHRDPAEIDLGMSTNNRTNPIKGNITFNGLRIENSRWSAIWTKKTLEAYHVTVRNATFKNISKAGDKAAIHIGLLGYGNRSNANMGGFTFENVSIDYDGNAPSLELFGPGHGNWDLANLRGEIRVRSPRGTRLYDNLNKLSNSNSTVDLRMLEN